MEWRPERVHSFNPNDAYKLTTVGSGNGLSPARHQAIIRTNAEILLFRNKWINFASEIYAFLFKKMHLKVSSAKWWQFCLGLNVFTQLCMLSDLILR